MTVNPGESLNELEMIANDFPNLWIGIGILLLITVLGMFSFIASSIWLYQMAKKDNLSIPILAFVPIVKFYFVGYLSNEYFFKTPLPSQHIGWIYGLIALFTTSIVLFEEMYILYPVFVTIAYIGFIFVLVKNQKLKWLFLPILIILNIIPFSYVSLIGLYKTKKG